MHPQLEEQVSRYLGSLDEVPESLRELLEAVDETYRQADERSALLERSMGLTSRELLERNQQLQEDLLAHKGTEEALQRLAERLATMREIDRAILTAKSPEEIATEAVERLRVLLKCRRASVALLDFESGEVTSLCVIGEGGERLTSFRYPMLEQHIPQGLRSGRVHIQDDLINVNSLNPYEEILREDGARSYLCVPLLARDQFIGMLNLASNSSAAFEDEQVEVAREVADELAVAVQQAALLREVQRLNETLEMRIRERTAQIERRAREIEVLNEMAELLQSCVNLEEAYEVVSQQMPRLFPSSDGAVGMLEEEGGRLRFPAEWGATGDSEKEYLREDCWALRRGQSHVVQKARPGLLCPHVKLSPKEETIASMCVPLTAQGELFGLFHLRGPHEATDYGSNRGGFSAPRQQLAHTVAEQVGLALANLKLRETLRSQAIRDPLTGLYNRRYMEESLSRETRRIARSGGHMGVIMLDIDDFKEYNDKFGHAVGDALLGALGEFLRSNVRQEDIACKYGGEEFVLILPDAPLEVTSERAEYLCSAVKSLKPEHEGRVFENVTLSLGVSVFPEHGSGWQEVLRAADAALYEAKAQGKDHVVVGKRYLAPEREDD